MSRRTWSVAGAVSLAGLGVLAHGMTGSSSQFFGPSVYQGSRRRRSIALTFDDGPSPKSLRLLDILARENVPATFFQCGRNVERHPSIARQIAAAGHEIGNHTYSHPRLCFHLPQTNAHEFEQAQRVIADETGINPKILRAPYGWRWFGMRPVQRRLGLLGVMWTVIGRDWESPAAAITKRVLSRSSPGGIICLHDGRDVQTNPEIDETLKAVPLIIGALKTQGYRFETVSSLLTNTI